MSVSFPLFTFADECTTDYTFYGCHHLFCTHIVETVVTKNKMSLLYKLYCVDKYKAEQLC